ncbi:CocE/NonD family hydrolase [Amycolatopsis tolypomycina]|uniref:CocE/NonD family hydrolase n=1 Tax=Amycolatopsis tolypomycina TaxID=208445 RepID=UPI0033B7E76E
MAAERTSGAKPGFAVLDDGWIPVADDLRLAARIWLPEGAGPGNPVPAVLEYTPYRKNDFTAARDHELHGYFAQHGVAGVRVDIRGTGDSDGHLDDEYLTTEIEDARAALAWIAAQPWCTGRVGMIGISWGGFSALQVAATRPPELAAVISVASSDDRYELDVHYIGGCMNAWDQVSWGTTLTALGALPPDPLVRSDWREVWRDRLERTRPVVDQWLGHQRKDEYWRHGSVSVDYRRITCPVFLVGGWADAYHDAVFRIAEAIPGLVDAVVGPWAHTFPHVGTPGPAIGFLQEAVRWWNRRLGDEPAGDAAPACRFWIQETTAPEAGYDDRGGRWVAEKEWPAPSVQAWRGYLAGRELRDDPPPPGSTPLVHRALLVPPGDRGNWCPGGWAPGAADFVRDQCAENERDLSFVTPALARSMTLLGFPRLHLGLTVDKPRALLAVRLCDNAPDGTSTLLSRGFLNLAHREDFARPRDVIPGDRLSVTIEFGAVGYEVPAGHRLGLFVSTTYWPWIWPSPEQVNLTVFPDGDTYLELPQRLPAEELAFEAFDPPLPGPVLETVPVGPPAGGTRRHVRGPANRLDIVDELAVFAERQVTTGRVYGGDGTSTFSVTEDDPLSARIETHRRFRLGDEDERIEVTVSSVLACDAAEFRLRTHLRATEGGTAVFSREWDDVVPRRHV